jgi:hypothetical protein
MNAVALVSDIFLSPLSDKIRPTRADAEQAVRTLLRYIGKIPTAKGSEIRQDV